MVKQKCNDGILEYLNFTNPLSKKAKDLVFIELHENQVFRFFIY